MPKSPEKFTVQVDGALIADLRRLAEQEHRPIQALVEEAIAALIEQRQLGMVRPHVVRAYQKEPRSLRAALQEARGVTRDGLTACRRAYSWTSKRKDLETIFHSPSILTRLKKSVK